MSLSYTFNLIPNFHPLLADTYNIYTARKVIPFQSYLRFVLYDGSADGDNPDFLLLWGLHIEAAILCIHLNAGYLFDAGRGFLLYAFHGDIDFRPDIADFILAFLVRLDNIRITEQAALYFHHHIFCRLLPYSPRLLLP